MRMCVVYVWCKLCPEVLNPGKTMMIMQFLNVVCFICFCTRVCVCVCVIACYVKKTCKAMTIMQCLNVVCFICFCTCVCVCVIAWLCEEDMQGNVDHAMLKCCVCHMFLHVCVIAWLCEEDMQGMQCLNVVCFICFCSWVGVFARVCNCACV